MRLDERARRMALNAAYGVGGLSLVSLAALGLLKVEATLARRWIGEPTEQAPRADGVFGGTHTGEPLHLVMLGDSSSAGLGVDLPSQTPGALLASGLAEVAERPVRLTSVARTGARTEHLKDQLDTVLAEGETPPHVAVIMVGANDVTHTVLPSESMLHLEAVVHRLRDAGVEVVIGTCPDLGTIEPVPQPLRWIARAWSRQLAAAQTICVVQAGGRSVSLGDILGPEFAAAPREMFSHDRFHPSVAGYRAAAMALLPSVCASLGLWAEATGEEAPDSRRGEGVRSVAKAAAEAVEHAGTEVGPVDGSDAGVVTWADWALLRHRRRRQIPEPGLSG